MDYRDFKAEWLQSAERLGGDVLYKRSAQRESGRESVQSLNPLVVFIK